MPAHAVEAARNARWKQSLREGRGITDGMLATNHDKSPTIFTFHVEGRSWIRNRHLAANARAHTPAGHDMGTTTGFEPHLVVAPGRAAAKYQTSPRRRPAGFSEASSTRRLNLAAAIQRVQVRTGNVRYVQVTYRCLYPDTCTHR